MTYDECKRLVASMPPDEIKGDASQYLPFLVMVTIAYCETGEFPHTAKTAWTKKEIKVQLGAEVALHPDCPEFKKIPKLKKRVSRSQAVVFYQWGNIMRCMHTKFKTAAAGTEWTIVALREKYYCTNDPADPNIELMWSRRKAQAKGNEVSANILHRPDQPRLHLVQYLQDERDAS